MIFSQEKIVGAELEQLVQSLMQYDSYYQPQQKQIGPSYESGGYRNISRLANIPWLRDVKWDPQLEFMGAYGAINIESHSISKNPCLRSNLEGSQKTDGHENLHYVNGFDDRFPGGRYPIEVLVDWIFWVEPKKPVYKN